MPPGCRRRLNFGRIACWMMRLVRASVRSAPAHSRPRCGLVSVRRDDEEDAVVHALLADAPGAAELIAVIGDLDALQRRDVTTTSWSLDLLLQRRRASPSSRPWSSGRQNVGVIDDPAGQRREFRRATGGRQRRRGTRATAAGTRRSLHRASWPRPAGLRPAPAAAPCSARREFTFGRALAPRRGGEGLHRLGARIEDRGPQRPGKVRSSVL